MDQRIVQDEQSRGTCFLEKVGVGEAANQPELFFRPEALLIVVAGIAAVCGHQPAGYKAGVYDQLLVREQEAQVVVDAGLQRSQ